ncbi:hypothetical protein GE061_012578 [Apolygus lucorum]|uniref:Uncharacterized protein n=1 Tax=Apolygus lucorum TaxID=248454 RepID=A0A8S9XSS1_APOLU|nr:hypothetical protein GE061_012578 [Apolygus lucorum]
MTEYNFCDIRDERGQRCYLLEMSSMLGTVLLGLCVMAIFQSDAEKVTQPKGFKLSFYHTRKTTPQLIQLFEEAMKDAGLDVMGTTLEVMREKMVKNGSYFKAYYLNQLGMNCYILFEVIMFQGTHMKMKLYKVKSYGDLHNRSGIGMLFQIFERHNYHTN